jgi:hypothetical protein
MMFHITDTNIQLFSPTFRPNPRLKVHLPLVLVFLAVELRHDLNCCAVLLQAPWVF